MEACERHIALAQLQILLTDAKPQLGYRRGACGWSGRFLSALNEVVYKRVDIIPDCPNIKEQTKTARELKGSQIAQS